MREKVSKKMPKYSAVGKKNENWVWDFFVCKKLQCHIELKHAKFHCHISMVYGLEIQGAELYGYLCVMIVITSVEVVVWREKTLSDRAETSI